MGAFDQQEKPTRMLWAMAGALVLGVIVPVVLTSAYISLSAQTAEAAEFVPPPAASNRSLLF